MSTLKERFDNLEVQPDSQVWTSISSTMRRHAVRRRTIIATSSVAVVAAVVLLIANMSNDGGVHSEQIAQSPVAGQLPSPAPDVQSSTSGSTDVTVSPVATKTTAAIPAEQPQQSSDLAMTAVPDAPTPSEPFMAATQPSVSPSEDINVLPNRPVQHQPTTNEVSTVEANTSTDATGTADGNVSQKISTPQTNKSQVSELAVWIPNAFAPDDPDERVRLFKVVPNNGATIASFEIFIYSRGGRLVYHSRDINQGWDGTANGHPQPMGTYAYIVQINDAAQGLQHHKGTITLIR